MQRSLFAGSESKLTSYAWLKPDCSTTVANVNVVTQPKKGTVRFEEAPDVVLASKSPIEKQCHGKPIRATHVYYSADKDALGTDRLVFDVDTKLGFIYRSTLLVNVEKPKPSATSAEASAGPKPFAEIRQSLPERRLLRSVLANSEARIAAMNYVNTDCTSGPLPSLRIVTEPKNGAYRLEETVIPVDRAAANSRSVCNGKPVSAIAVFYKPNAEYTGTDDMVIDTDYHDGNVSRFVYAITVR